MNGKSKIWAIALLAGVLLIGGLAGAAVDRRIIGPPACAPSEDGRRSRGERDGDRYARYLDWLSAELSLSAAQRADVEQRIESHRAAVRELWREMRPRYEEMKEELRTEIRAVLTADQVVAYEALLEESDRKRHRHEEESKQR